MRNLHIFKHSLRILDATLAIMVIGMVAIGVARKYH